MAFDALDKFDRRLGRLLHPAEFAQASSHLLQGKYESLKEVLAKPAEESLSNEGLGKVLKKFSKDGAKTLPEDLNLIGIFSYYDAKNDLKFFRELLKPEVFQELQNNFQLSGRTAYISEGEHFKLEQFLNKQITLPKVKDLSNYLICKVGQFSKLSDEEIANYQFGQSDLFKEEDREKFAQEFRSLLGTQRPTSKQEREEFDQRLAELFKETLSLEDEIKDKKQDNLATFFSRDKHLLARLLEQPQGLDKFSAAIRSIADGCYANIGTQVRIALSASLISDPYDQVLFSVFNDKISTPIINKEAGGVDHALEDTGAGEIFNYNAVNKQFLSPIGLVKAIEREFFDGNIKIRDPLLLIETKLGKEWKETLGNELLGDDFSAERLNEGSSKIVTYLVIQNTIPSLLNHEYLAEFKQSCESLLKITDQKMKIQEEVRKESAKTLANAVISNAINTPATSKLKQKFEAAQKQDAEISTTHLKNSVREKIQAAQNFSEEKTQEHRQPNPNPRKPSGEKPINTRPNQASKFKL